MYQCENCDEEFDRNPMQEINSVTGKSVFCSVDCWLDAKEEIYVARREAAREYEVYGDDYDSWFR